MRVWVPRHGFPAVLLSDNGRQFTSQVLQGMRRATGVDQLFSTAYHPQGNSVVESYMRTLRRGLSVLVNAAGIDWDRQVAAVVFAYNTTPHVATGFTPFFLAHGREAMLPLFRELGEPRLEPATQQWLERLWEARRKVYEHHLQEVQRRQALFAAADRGLPVGAWVAERLRPAELRDVSAKFAGAAHGL